MADTKLSQLTLKTGDMVASDLVEITEGGNTTKSVTGTKILGLVSTSGNAATVTNGVYTVGTQNIGGDKTFGDDVTITGDLTVNGTTTTIDTTNLTVSDPLVKFGQDYIGSAYDQGFVVTRGNGSATNTANRGFIWDETADEFVAIACNTEDGTTAGNVTIDSYVNMRVAKLTGSSLDISGDVDVDGTLEADAITLNGTALGSLYSPIAGGSGIVTTGAINSGSITSGFGTIDNGASAITTTGALGAGTATFAGDVALTAGNMTIDSGGTGTFLTLQDNGSGASFRPYVAAYSNELRLRGGFNGAANLVLDGSSNATFAGDIMTGVTSLPSAGEAGTYLAAAGYTYSSRAGTTKAPHFLMTNNNGTAGSLSSSGTGELLISSGTGNTTALTLDNSQNATFAGDVSMLDGVATFKNLADSPLVLVAGTSGDKEALTFERNGASVKGSIEYHQSPIGFSIGTDTSHAFNIKTSGTTALTLDASQNATFAGDIVGSASVDLTASTSAEGVFIGKSNSTADSVAGVQARADGLFYVVKTSGVGILYGNLDTGGASQEAVRFVRNGADVGSIDTTSTATAYNTSSDPRIKSVFSPIKGSDAVSLIIEAVENNYLGEFSFLSDPKKKVWGYNAHALIDNQEGFGGSEGFGPRDAEIGDVVNSASYDEDDKEITPEEKVTPAGVDQSKRVPMLEAAIYQLIQDNKALTLRLEALENV